MATHYIAIAGLHGYIPNFCEAVPDHESAIDILAQVHELGRGRIRELRNNDYLELNLHRDGNEYCEIAECDCDTPEVHCDSGEYSG